MRRANSVRGRLVCVVIVLAALGMAIVDTASIVALQVYLRDRADVWLKDARTRVSISIAAAPVVIDTATLNSWLQPGYVITLVGPDGRIVHQTPAEDSPGQPAPAPTLPTPLRSDFAAQPTTVASAGGPDYRVQMFDVGTRVHFTKPDGTSVPVAGALLAESLSPTADALDRLVLFELMATLVALAGIGLLSFGVLKVGLLPLRDMARTARRIAAGESFRRRGMG